MQETSLSDRGEGLSSLIGTIWRSAVPNSQFYAEATATGVRDVDRKALQEVAVGFCLDRLKNVYNPDGGLGAVVSCYVTHNHDTDGAPTCKVRIGVLGVSKNILLNIFKAVPGNLLNTSDTITVGAKQFGPAGQGPAMYSNNTRGSWAARLVAQALAAPANAYDLPANPPAATQVQDTARPA